MECVAYFGKLNTKRANNPFEVLNEPVLLERKGHDLLFHGSKYFKEKEQIDWGSFLYKCTKDEIIKFLSDFKITLSWLIESEEKEIENVMNYITEHGNVEYGVVFVEMS